jgi:hypothetical protein
VKRVHPDLWALYHCARDAQNIHAAYAANQAIRAASRNLLADSNAWRALAEFELANESPKLAGKLAGSDADPSGDEVSA